MRKNDWVCTKEAPRKGIKGNPGIVVHICNPSPWKAETGGLGVWGQLYSWDPNSKQKKKM
jgi:hypothetical protein